MEVNCPHCEYKGFLPEGVIPKSGKDLNCPKCKKQFFIEKPKKQSKNKPKKLTKIIAGVVLAGAIGVGSFFGYIRYKNYNNEQELKKQLQNYELTNIKPKFNSVSLTIKSETKRRSSMEEFLKDHLDQLGMGFKSMYEIWPGKEKYTIKLEGFLDEYDCTFDSKEKEFENKDNKILNKAVCISSEGEEKYLKLLEGALRDKIDQDAKKEAIAFSDIIINEFFPKMKEILSISSQRNELITEAMNNYQKINNGTCRLWEEDIRDETRIIKNIVKPLRSITDSRLKECMYFLDEILRYEQKARYMTNSMCRCTSYDTSFRNECFEDDVDEFKAYIFREAENVKFLVDCLANVVKEVE